MKLTARGERLANVKISAKGIESVNKIRIEKAELFVKGRKAEVFCKEDAGLPTETVRCSRGRSACPLRRRSREVRDEELPEQLSENRTGAG
jgi:hypothetical protein